jgi:antirestriction protein
VGQPYQRKACPVQQACIRGEGDSLVLHGDAFEEAYQGEYRSSVDFAENLVDDLGMLNDMPENLRYYFDYEAFARDLLMTDYWCDSTETYFFRHI